MRVEEALKAISGEEFINARKLARKDTLKYTEKGRGGSRFIGQLIQLSTNLWKNHIIYICALSVI
ncbi:MAG: hypothetical protein QXM71_07520 [Thermofilum sp.]